MPDRPQLRVIIYDIVDNRRRRKIAKLLEDKAARVQDSAFEARLSTAQTARLQAKLETLIGVEDSLRIYTVPDAALPRCTVKGGPMIADGSRFWLM